MSTYLSTYWTLFGHLVDYNSTSLIRSCPSCWPGKLLPVVWLVSITWCNCSRYRMPRQTVKPPISRTMTVGLGGKRSIDWLLTRKAPAEMVCATITRPSSTVLTSGLVKSVNWGIPVVPAAVCLHLSLASRVTRISRIQKDVKDENR